MRRRDKRGHSGIGGNGRVFGRLTNWLRQKNILIVTGLAVGGGLAGGLAMWGGFNLTAAYFSTSEFCASCHEMQQNVEQYRQSIHYSNVYGVRAECADCHVPKPFFPHAVHMVVSLREVADHFLGTIDTPEKFKKKKPELAERVWAEMEADNSRGCRSCHSFQAMEFDQQPIEASKNMHRAMQEGLTCIDCHRGIVHDLPEGASPRSKKGEALIASLAPTASSPATTPTGTAPQPTTAAPVMPKVTVPLSVGEEAFARAKTPLSTDEKHDTFGSVTPGTPVKIVKLAGDLAEVRLDGWSMTGAEQILFAAQGQRIALAHLSSTDTTNREVTEHSKDIYGTDWQHVVVTGWVPAASLDNNVSDVWQRADALYKKRCTACHALHQPKEFTANQWPHILKIMTKRAGLTESDTELVTQYLQTEASLQRANSKGGNESTSRARR